MSAFGSYLLGASGGLQSYSYDYFGRLAYEGNPENTNYTEVTDGVAAGSGKCPSGGSIYECNVITDYAGRSIVIAYTGYGFVTEVVDPIGRAYPIGVDSTLDLASVSDPAGDTWRFGYTSNEASPENHNMATLTDPDGHATTYNYTYSSGNANGMVSSVLDATGANRTTFSYGYLCGGSCADTSQYTTVSYPDAQYVYDELADGIIYAQGIGTEIQGGPLFANWTYDWGGVGSNQVTETVLGPTGPSGSSSYEETVDVTDGVGNHLQTTNALGGVTTAAYNSYNEPCFVSPPGVPLPSGASCANPPAAGSGATLYAYDLYGNEIERADPMGNITVYAYTSLGELCYLVPPGVSIPSGSSCTNAPPGSARYDFDADNVLLAETTPDGVGTNYGYDTTTYTHDPDGEITSMVSPNGNLSGANPANYETYYYYDSAGRLREVGAPMGRDTYYSYDQASNLTEVEDPSGFYYTYAYDSDNRQCLSAP